MILETRVMPASSMRERAAPDQGGNPSVELRGIHKRFAGIVAVDGISLRVQPGEFLTLLGPSGCGKTTTLRLIAGFEHPSGGEVLIDGLSVAGLPPNRRNVNTVFQNYALFPHMNVAANIGFGMRMKHVAPAERERRVSEALQMVRLEGLGMRRPTQLSGGQQQRVALARALVNRPAVLLLDEPLGALDLKLRRAMQAELRHLNRSVGITFIYVTHDQEEALTMSDRIAVMSGGRILQLGTAREIYETPATRFVADFIGESNFLDGTFTSLHEGIAMVEIPGAGTIRARCSHPLTTGAGATVAIRPERIAIESPGETPAPGDNRVTANVSEAIYAGSTMLYTVVLAGGAKLVLRTANTGAVSTPGTALWLHWQPEACAVLAD